MVDLFKQSKQSINNLRYKFDQGARANRYEVRIMCPFFSLDAVRCTSATLPGRSLEVEEFSEYGPLRKMPNNISMDGGEATFEFLCDSSFADRFLIEAWQDTIYASPNTDHGISNSLHPQFSYYNDYIGEVQIDVLNQRDNATLCYKLFEAYPLSYEAQELSYESTDEIMKFSVTMAFRTFETEYKEQQPTILDALNKGNRIAGSLNQALGVFGKDSKALRKFQDRLNNISKIAGGFGI